MTRYRINVFRNPLLDSIILGLNKPITNYVMGRLQKPPIPYDYSLPVNNETPSYAGSSSILSNSPKDPRTDTIPRFKSSPKSDTYIYIFLEGRNAPPNGDPYLIIPTTPTEMEVFTQADLKGLNIIGDDLQTYHYGGGESTLTFEFIWMGMKKPGQLSALDKAVRFEALSRGQGWYLNRPPVITMKWGKGDFTPFKDQRFVVEKAPYKPWLFTLHNHSRPATSRQSVTDSLSLESNHFHPQYVKQDVTLKRVY